MSEAAYNMMKEKASGHYIAGTAGVISFAGLVTFMVLVSKQQKKKGLSSSKVLASNLFMFVILASLLAQIAVGETDENYTAVGLAFLVLICVASLVITLLM
jgi:hypothetical protein